MRGMPDPPRASKHEVSAEALQSWIWNCVAAGWDPSQLSVERWSHDDNQMAMQHGWMISQPPNSAHVDLFSLRTNTTPAQVMTLLVKLAPIDPLAARAVAMLTAQRLKYPDIKFAYAKGIE